MSQQFAPKSILARCDLCGSVMFTDGTAKIVNPNCNHQFKAPTVKKTTISNLPTLQEAYRLDKVRAVLSKTDKYIKEFNNDKKQLLRNHQQTQYDIKNEVEQLIQALRVRQDVLLKEAKERFVERNKELQNTLQLLQNHKQYCEKTRDSMVSSLNEEFSSLNEREKRNVEMAEKFVQSTPTIQKIPLDLAFNPQNKYLCTQSFDDFGKLDYTGMEIGKQLVEDYGPEGAVAEVRGIDEKPSPRNMSSSSQNRRETRGNNLNPGKNLKIGLRYNNKKHEVSLSSSNLSIENLLIEGSKAYNFDKNSMSMNIVETSSDLIVNRNVSTDAFLLDKRWNNYHIQFKEKEEEKIDFPQFKLISAKKGDNNSILIYRYKFTFKNENDVNVYKNTLFLSVECYDRNTNSKIFENEYLALEKKVGNRNFKYELEINSSDLSNHILITQVRLKFKNQYSNYEKGPREIDMNDGFGGSNINNSIPKANPSPVSVPSVKPQEPVNVGNSGKKNKYISSDKLNEQIKLGEKGKISVKVQLVGRSGMKRCTLKNIGSLSFDDIKQSISKKAEYKSGNPFHIVIAQGQNVDEKIESKDDLALLDDKGVVKIDEA